MNLKIGWGDIVVEEIDGVREPVQVFCKDGTPERFRSAEDVVFSIPADKVAATIILPDSKLLCGGIEDDLDRMILLNRKDLVKATEEEKDRFLSVLLVNEYFHVGEVTKGLLKAYKDKIGYEESLL